MIGLAERIERFGLAGHSLSPRGDVYWNLGRAQLIEQAIARGEGQLAESGAFVATTGAFTGRSPKDRFIVREPTSDASIGWGKVNVALPESSFDALAELTREELELSDVFVRDAWCGADRRFRLGVRIITATAWHNLFAANMFIPPTDSELESFEPDWTVLHAPSAMADPATHSTSSGTYVVLNFGKRTVIIGGTEYAGELKKAIFSVMNFLLPARDVLPMHCSANVGTGGDVALFFGLSGTGKTTLSADPDRPLIGDDEHGWGPDGVFNFEGGSYAKAIGITEESEPEIYRASSRFGTILENVVIDPVSHVPDYSDNSLTENTRASYPLDHLENIEASGVAGHPKTIVFLTADAFGVLPPISRLSPEQAMYHFLAGYTAKVAGTERGVKEPVATFSACFGEPFLPRRPAEYADMLGDRMRKHGVSVWLVNTGWTGGPFGVGHRIALKHTRAMIGSAIDGSLGDAPTVRHPVFGVEVPCAVEGVPDAVLDPRSTWTDSDEYDKQARALAALFRKNFEPFEADVPDAVRAVAPLAG